MSSAYICKNCGSDAVKLTNTGSISWVLFWLIGAILSVITLPTMALATFLQMIFAVGTVVSFIKGIFTWGRICKACNSGDVVHVSTPIGQKLYSEYHNSEKKVRIVAPEQVTLVK